MNPTAKELPDPGTQILVASLREIERSAAAALARVEAAEEGAPLGSVAIWLRAIRAEARAALRAVDG